MYVSSGLHWLGYWELALGALQSHVVFPHTGLVMGFWVFVLPPVVVLLKMIFLVVELEWVPRTGTGMLGVVRGLCFSSRKAFLFRRSW